jgi:hypothetical protein
MMHVSLDILIGCGEKFKGPQIARICHEVSTLFDDGSMKLIIKLLLAIVNLISKGLQHGNITPSSVLFISSGVTKLGTYCTGSLYSKLIIKLIFMNVLHGKNPSC